MTIAKHSVTRRSGMLADVANADERTALYENTKNLDLRLRLDRLSDFKAICSSLSEFGLSKNEVKVYVYLAKFGEQKANNVSRSLSLHRTETYKILKRLEEKSLAYRILQKPIRFAVTPIDRALETLIQERRQELVSLEEEKHRILSDWNLFAVPPQDSNAVDEFIQVLKGRNQIYIRINEIIENAKDEILIAASDENLLQMFYSGALDDLASKSSRIKVQLMTNPSMRSSYIVKKLRLEEDEFLCVDFTGLPSFVISNDHLLLFLNNENGNGENGKNGKRALWTNQKDIITVLKASFFTLNGNHAAAKAAS